MALVFRVISEIEDIIEVLLYKVQYSEYSFSDLHIDALSISWPHHHLGVAGGANDKKYMSQVFQHIC